MKNAHKAARMASQIVGSNSNHENNFYINSVYKFKFKRICNCTNKTFEIQGNDNKW